MTEFHLSTNDDIATDLDPAESSEIRTRFRTALGALPRHEFGAVNDKVDGVLSPAQRERYHAMPAKPELRFRPRNDRRPSFP